MWAVGEGCGGHVYLGGGMRKPDVPSPEPHRSPSGKLSSSSQILEADARHLSWGEAAAPPTPYPPQKNPGGRGPREKLGPSSPSLGPWEFESKCLLVNITCSKREISAARILAVAWISAGQRACLPGPTSVCVSKTHTHTSSRFQWDFLNTQETPQIPRVRAPTPTLQSPSP